MLYPDIKKLQKKPQQNTTRYRTALYLRLSREDGDKTESDSIANQRTLLEAYAIDHPELCIVDEFVDDGYSGSNFERPAFQRLFRELEQGTINCVLVKDLSRFGRNYIEVGRYLERIFPVMRVRLIAVTDNYDSQSAWKPAIPSWSRCGTCSTMRTAGTFPSKSRASLRSSGNAVILWEVCSLWIPEGSQQSYQADCGRTGSGNSARYFPLEDQWHE